MECLAHQGIGVLDVELIVTWSLLHHCLTSHALVISMDISILII